MVGQKFGRQEIRKILKAGLVEVGCECGQVRVIHHANLVSGASKSCGCLRRSIGVPTEIGDVYGNLQVLQVFTGSPRGTECLCACTCGCHHVTTAIRLRLGRTKSCGCQKMAGARKARTTHGQTSTYMYNAWQSMKKRTSRAIEYPTYVGINVHPTWANSYETFRDYVLSTIGERPSPLHSLDRVDGKKDYEPGNLRWGDHAQQTRNRRSTIMVTHDGVTQCASDWAKQHGMAAAVFIRRFHLGWPVDKILSTPIGTRSPYRK